VARLSELIAVRFSLDLLERVRRVLPADWPLSQYIRIAVLEKVRRDEKEREP